MDMTIQANFQFKPGMTTNTQFYITGRLTAGNQYAFIVQGNGSIGILVRVNSVWSSSLASDNIGTVFTNTTYQVSLSIKGEALRGEIQQVGTNNLFRIQATAAPVSTTPGTVSVGISGNLDQAVTVDDIVVEVHDVTRWKPTVVPIRMESIPAFRR